MEKEIILFIASLSKECNYSLDFIRKRNLSVKIVRLDTEHARNMAANGKVFQIRMVPTMIINYEDGNTEIFIGNKKIIPVLSAISDKKMEEYYEPGRQSYHPGGFDPSSENMYSSPVGELRPPSKPVYAARPTIPKTANREADEVLIVEEEYDSDHEYDSDNVEEDDENYSDEKTSETKTPMSKAPKAKAPKSKASKSTRSKSQEKQVEVKKYKSPPVLFDEMEDEEPSVSIPPSKKGEGINRMQSLIDKAKQLENERSQSLGYNEEDLPKYY